MELQKIAKFERVSEKLYNQFVKEAENSTALVKYGEIQLPQRATEGSAGYDFICTDFVALKPNESAIINTFVKVYMEPGWALTIIPRSGLGFKYFVRLANTIGLIDTDYYNNESNEGCIMVKIRNEGEKTMVLEPGDRFCQGMLVPYGITYDDDAHQKMIREGGTGSTGTTTEIHDNSKEDSKMSDTAASGGVKSPNIKKVKVFISQPMNGKENVEIKKERRNILDKAVIPNLYSFVTDHHDYDAIALDAADTIFDLEDGTHALVYLGKSLVEMADCVMCFFPKNYADYRGCNIEHTCAIAYDMPIMYYEPELLG
jgi:dUTP pyrophosphatase